MKHTYVPLTTAGRLVWLALGVLLAIATAHAQAPAWRGAVFGTSQAGGSAIAHATATDASGNVFVTGVFTGTAVFGATTLTDQGAGDVFVAKYVPATSSWAWAVRAGGTYNDEGMSLAVVGNSVYVLGNFTNSSADAYGVLFQDTGSTSGSVVKGATASASPDIFLAKYVDQGNTTTLAWTQVAGGIAADYSYGLAASGSSLYVLTSIQNDIANTNGVLFGGNGSTPGTSTVRGATTSTSLDLCLVKYVDQGSGATLAWTQVGGGTAQDFGSAVALSGTSVYIVGSLWNNQTNANGVLFGSTGTTTGTTTVRGASAIASPDLLVAKYLDNGNSATLAWTQVGGGTSYDVAGGLAVSGNNVYVSGTIRTDATNTNGVLFGGNGTTVGTSAVRGMATTSSPDFILAKYTDNGRTATLGWVQVGGGSGQDGGQGVAVSGTGIYVTGAIVNNAANTNGVFFGGTGTTAGTVPVAGTSSQLTNDLLLVKYIDQGTSATLNWVQVGGGADSDVGQGVTVSGQWVYVSGYASVPGAFGSTTTAGSVGSSSAVIAYLADATLTPLATRVIGTEPVLQAFPNPSAGRVTLIGAAPGGQLDVRDVLGRRVTTVTASLNGTVSLVLPTGLYLVQTGTQVTRLLVQQGG